MVGEGNDASHSGGSLDITGTPPIPPRQLRAEISRVAVKIPPFWKPNVNLWFMQVESQFVTASITSEETKFHYVLGAIESDVLNQVSDFLTTLPADRKYTRLKTKLIEEFSDSEERKARKLLNEIRLGDKKPSALLREMRQLAGTDISEQFLRNMFLQNVPPQVRAILTCSKDSLESLALMADRIVDTAPIEQSAFAIEPPTGSYQALERQIAQLTEKLSNLHSSRPPNRSSNRSRSRQRSQSRSKSAQQRYSVCWYHHKFGANANRCQTPCAHNSKASGN